MNSIQCRVCGQQSDFLRTDTFINKYSISYYKCAHCRFIQTEKPYWLSEAYSDALVIKDTGLVARSLRSSYWVSAIIKMLFKPEKNFIDFGGGYGLFVRRMRDIGYSFFWADKYAENLLAKGSEANLNATYHLLTAFEVAEHLENPMIDWEEWGKLAENLFISTMLYKGDDAPNSSWWYYAQHSGQHIAIYHQETMKFLAKKLNKHYYGNNTFHLFTQNPQNTLKIKLLFFLLNRNLLPPKWFFNGSLTEADSKNF